MVQFRRDWLENIDSMQREMEQLLDQFATRKPPLVRFSPRAWEPAIDMYETPQAMVVMVELAGLRQEDIDITVHAKTLVIRGERRESQEGNKRTYYQMEIFKGHFERGILLPVEVDIDQTKASYHDGILEIVLPKRVDDQIRKVDIRTA